MKISTPFMEIDAKLKGKVPKQSNSMIAKLIDVKETGFSCLKQVCEVIM